MGVLADVHLEAELLVEHADHAGIAGHPPREGDLLVDPDPAQQTDRARDDGVVDTQQHVLDLLTLPDQGQDLAVGKDRAGRGDLHRPVGLQRGRTELVEREVERTGRGPEEATGSRRALVVHDEVEDLSGSAHLDRLGVLASHIHDGPCPGEHMHRTPAVTGDLRGLGITEGHLVAAIPGPDDEADALLLLVDVALLQRQLVGGLRRDRHVRTGGDEGSTHDLQVLVDDHCLCLGRTNVDPCCIRHL